MSDATARFALPLIVPGQAQKELFHNEALARIDGALHAAAEGPALAVPPADPSPGQCWIVAAGASGAWAGKTDAIAAWTEGGWRFVEPQPGMLVWNKTAHVWIHWAGTAWSEGELPATGISIGGVQVVAERQPHVPSPSGGTVIDVEARSAIDALIATLMSHGLME
jgi:hypothetical protein